MPTPDALIPPARYAPLRRIRQLALAGVALVGLGIAACSTSTNPSSGSSAVPAASATVKIGMIYPRTGPLSAYGEEYRQGLEAGLAFVTHGTGKVDGKQIEVDWKDGAGNPSQAVSQAKTLIGQGYKILAGPADSAVALQVAAVAAQNKVLFISGPAAVDQITGINRYTFRSGRQTWQDVKTAAAIMDAPAGKHVLVFAQDYAFGQANAAAVKAVLGAEGAHVTNLLVPLTTTDFTPFAQKITNAKPDLLFVAWAGTSAYPMWNTLDQQGIFDHTTVVTGLGNVATYGAYGPATTKLRFLSYYFPDAPDNAVNAAMKDLITKAGGTPDLFSPDGFVAAQMIAHAVEATQGSGDVDGMIKALEGWSFDAPKGRQTIRASDHAMLQPEYVAKLVRQGNGYTPELVKTVSAEAIAPPVAGK
ncbi:MAG: substrate-binding domain-containing protein [Xanthomonadales bacterium]|nr:substrate-binding domain-containing protein [Xanthomonadales bacterium]ODU94620.1 MAG: amino acid ABC transporter substrate-binding protein [Rhodanobacter sp. SCN 66-43]OJY85202.1 MAG: amino acid ABC transporter substrate-binding protein [Xanthomonadales bacterium 66-474]